MTGIIKTDQLQGAQSSTITVPSGNNLTVGGTLGVTGAITGTLATAAQTNITSVGTLTSFRSTGIDDNADALAITINSSENVGFGITTPLSRIHIKQHSTAYGIVVEANGNDAWTRVHHNDTLGILETIYNSSAGYTPLTFKTGGSERLRIDTSGNVLVGTTNANPAEQNVAGIGLLAGNSISVTDDGGAPIQLNRKTSDGAIAIFRKDGSSVGSIGVTSGDQIYIGRTTGSQGIKLKNSALLPSSDAGADADNSKDLGTSSARWKDLYLSGGLRVGGTGTANTLDDYEEGTWTPTTNNGTGYSAQFGRYVKIGKMVWLNANINTSSTSGIGNIIQGLPFASSNTGNSAGNVSIGYYAGVNTAMIWLSGYVLNGSHNIYVSGNSSNVSTIQHNGAAMFNGNSRIMFSVVYEAA